MEVKEIFFSPLVVEAVHHVFLLATYISNSWSMWFRNRMPSLGFWLQRQVTKFTADRNYKVLCLALE